MKGTDIYSRYCLFMSWTSSSSSDMFIYFLLRFLKCFWHAVDVCIRSYTIYCSVLPAVLPYAGCTLFNLRIFLSSQNVFYGLTQSCFSKHLPVWWKSVCNSFFYPSPFPSWCFIQQSFPVTHAISRRLFYSYDESEQWCRWISDWYISEMKLSLLVLDNSLWFSWIWCKFGCYIWQNGTFLSFVHT
jgi:hypothetical protein